MTLRYPGVDAGSSLCLRERVPRKPIKDPAIDRPIDKCLDAIEKAWRGNDPKKSLRGLVYKTRDGVPERGIVAESTWHDWRSGKATPDVLELRRVARAVGLDVRLPGQDALDATGSVALRSGEGVKVKPETADVVELMEGWPEAARVALKKYAFEKNRELLANPQDADESGPSLARKHQ